MERTLREWLPRSYGALLGRFSAPTKIQLEAVPEIMGGRDVLLCAPTASGKTEAYAAPSAERVLGTARDQGNELPRLLLVSPTRALANDLFRRLAPRFTDLDLPLGRYTGEYKERGKSVWPLGLVTTPESLDSLLARRAHVLANVQCVVIDEIHVLDGTARGDQLRLLLHRLAHAAKAPLQRIAASATVGNAEDLAARYLVDPVVCSAAGDRRVKAKSFAGTKPAAMQNHLKELAKAGLRKILIFVPSRQDVDELALKLKGRAPFGQMVFAHHGSLSQSVRERTERQFHDAPAAVAIATTTLELGIDIGSVDYVVLSSPPASIASMMQRIGRGGRRKGTVRFGYAWRDEGEEFRFKVMARAGVLGDWLESPYAFRAGVLAQQAIGIAGGYGFVSVARLRSILPPELAQSISDADLGEMLENMVAREQLEVGRRGQFVLTERTEARYDRGTLHSNLAATSGVDVVDRLTGDVVGQVSGQSSDHSKMALGGAGRRVVSSDEGRILTDAAEGGQGVRYVTHGSPLTSMGLGRAIAEALGAGPQGLLLVRCMDHFRLVHGLGTLGGLFLARILAEQGHVVQTKGAGPVTIALPHDPRPCPTPGPADVDAFVRSHRARLSRLAAMGPFHGVLPVEWGHAALVQASGLAKVAEFLAHAQWLDPVDLEDVNPAVLHL